MRHLGPLPRGLRFDVKTGSLAGVPTLPAKRPVVKIKRIQTKAGLKRVRTLVRVKPVARRYTLYLVATDTLGQRDSQKMHLTVRP